MDQQERELWETVKPYLDGCELKKDAPEEIKAAHEELRRIAWEQGQ